MAEIGWLITLAMPVCFGLLYVALVAMDLGGPAGMLMHAIGRGPQRLRSRRGAAALGLQFGQNVLACAAPLILALLARSLDLATRHHLPEVSEAPLHALEAQVRAKRDTR